MGREQNELHHQFSLSYIKLCMTKEVQKEFGPPLKEGNYCIYNDNFKEIYRVNDFP
jgi:hypothetical protein